MEDFAIKALGSIFNWYGEKLVLLRCIVNALRMVSKGRNEEALKLIPPGELYQVRSVLAEWIHMFETTPKWYLSFMTLEARLLLGKEVFDVENHKKLLNLL